MPLRFKTHVKRWNNDTNMRPSWAPARPLGKRGWSTLQKAQAVIAFLS